MAVDGAVAGSCAGGRAVCVRRGLDTARMSDVFRAGLLDGQVAVVSGGGTGLGRAIALELASLGMTVAILGRRQEPLDETVALAADGAGPEAGADPDAAAEDGESGPPPSSRGRVEAVRCDVREEDEVDAAIDGVLERHGRIDLLVNNAGGQFLAPAEEITPKGFRTVMRLNVESAWLMTHAVATKAMIPARRGKVVSITLSPHNGLPGMAHSSAARAAVENLMKVLSIEWARFGILLNAIAPGQFGTDTFMTKYPQRMVDEAAGWIPLGRLGRPEEIAWLVAHLASPAGDFTSGSVITVDGARDNHLGTWPEGFGGDGTGNPLVEARKPR